MLATDGIMAAFKGRHKLKVHMPAKPTKWGYYTWSLAGVLDYAYNLETVGEHDRKGALVDETLVKGRGESGYVVASLTQLQDRCTQKVYFENYFGSPDLLVYFIKGRLCSLNPENKQKSQLSCNK